MKAHIDREKIKSIIEFLPEIKAAVTDEIPAELLQHVGKKGITPVIRIVNNCYNTGELPEDFISTTFLTMPKVSGTQKCNEYRTSRLIFHASNLC